VQRHAGLDGDLARRGVEVDEVGMAVQAQLDAVGTADARERVAAADGPDARGRLLVLPSEALIPSSANGGRRTADSYA